MVNNFDGAWSCHNKIHKLVQVIYSHNVILNMKDDKSEKHRLSARLHRSMSGTNTLGHSSDSQMHAKHMDSMKKLIIVIGSCRMFVL